ncbi:septal ring lytic transglycosylase RlpA family protein [Rhodohalobacter sp. SW132]|uniref:septal ring lytic transglycosylase RlpA family protein n=1 Tax=Rhodohalobacter sp. SW132 TaxID=2293433 RepID=UPI0013155942|nr:septal ring lytic transglycosylase RlpA family protein [Rhodohalobacter sp. SW132]
MQACGIVRTTERQPSPRSAEDVDAGMMLQSGVASWYGSKFHGRATANGETYNMNDFTAAHRTLPFNTVVKVENLDNGSSVVVRINDRGPYVDNRVIDLSRRAAREIDMENAGTANVEIYLVEEGDRPIGDRRVTNIETYTVQLASFNTEREANAYSQRISGSRAERVTFGNAVAYRVYYGTFSSISDARDAQRRLARQGHEGFVKQAEN